MKFLKPFIEFLGTFIALTIIYYGSQRLPKHMPLIVGLAFALVVATFQSVSSNFNPAITTMFVIAKKQPVSSLVYFIVPQLLAAFFAFEVNKYIFRV